MRRSLSELVNECLQRDIDFVLFPGDLVYGAGVGTALSSRSNCGTGSGDAAAV